MKTTITIMVTIFLIVSMQAQQPKTVEEAKGLKTGVKAPLFKTIDADSNTFYLETTLKKGPVVMIFYRGHWCPVCNKHLGKIQDSLKLITNKGATVIAISPQKPEQLNEMRKKTNAKFTLLYDKDYEIAKAYDVNFEPQKAELAIYNVFLNAKLKETQSDKSQQLPIPATYIIDKSGTIVWRQFDPDYKNRSTVKNILKNLP